MADSMVVYEAPKPSTKGQPAWIVKRKPPCINQRRSSIKSRASSTEAVEFFNLLTSPELLQMTEALLPKHRERLYPPTVTLSMFMRQVLEADGSCQKAVNGWAAQRAADGLSACSVRTGG